MESTPTSVLYSTDDVTLAAYLVIKEYHLKIIEKHENHGTFVFVDVPDEVVQEYECGSARVEPRKFSFEMRNLISNVRKA
jgi:hypothetical protein